MRLKDLLKEGPLKFLVKNTGPNRSKRRAEMATKRKEKTHKLLTSQARKKKRKVKKQHRKQAHGLRKA